MPKKTAKKTKKKPPKKPTENFSRVLLVFFLLNFGPKWPQMTPK